MVLGNLRYRNSYPIERGSLPLDARAFCAVKVKSSRGRNWACNGHLLNPVSGERRKVFVTHRDDLSVAEFEAEFSRRCFAEEVIEGSPEFNLFNIKLVPIFCAKFSPKAGGHEHHGDGDETDEYVLIHDRVKGEVQELLFLNEGRSSSSDHPHPAIVSLAIASYHLSGGSCVISGVKGVGETFGDGQGNLTYRVTSLTVHSLTKEYGASDRGLAGIEDFLDWVGLETVPQNSSCDACDGQEYGLQNTRLTEPSAPPDYESVTEPASYEHYVTMTSLHEIYSCRCQPSAPELSEDNDGNVANMVNQEHRPQDIAEEQIIAWLRSHTIHGAEDILTMIRGAPPPYTP